MNNYQAAGRLKHGEMNKTEVQYARHLEGRRIAGEILWYKFEPIKFRLAVNTSYSPDFLVLTAAGIIECHEVKAIWRNLGKVGWKDDARAKIKVAAEMFPFVFISAAYDRVAGWKFEEF